MVFNHISSFINIIILTHTNFLYKNNNFSLSKNDCFASQYYLNTKSKEIMIRNHNNML